MKFGTLVRGDHKVFQEIQMRVPDGGIIRARSISFDGRELPALVFERDASRGSYVLVVGLFAFGQSVDLEVIDGNGRVTDSCTRKIHHASSAIISKISTATRSKHAEQIRNFDAVSRVDKIDIDVGYQMRFGYEDDGTELVYATANCRCVSGQIPDPNLHFRVFDISGNEIELIKPTLLSNKTDDNARTVEFSFRKPASVEEYLLWAYYNEGESPAGLVRMSQDAVAEARKCFEYRFAYTGQGGFYEPWFEKEQKCPAEEIDRQRDARFAIEPLFSIIVPLYKTPIGLFEDMLESVLNQTYRHFELILVNASPEDEELRQAVERAKTADNRVRAITLDDNYGIALNTNEGIKIARGDFISFFDHDDTLEPSLFYEYVKAINEYPETDLLYCDEDKLSDDHLVEGFQKPDFSWELLTTCNYICHLLTVRKSIVDTVELSGADVAGAQDWDMTMKVAEKARNVFHVRKVLYHWRKHERSASANPNAKPYTHTAGEIAVQRHFERIGIPAKVMDSPMGSNVHRVDYELPDPVPRVSIVVPCMSDEKTLERCLRSIIDTSAFEYAEIILVSTEANKDTAEACISRLKLRRAVVPTAETDSSARHAALCNQGASQAIGDYILFLSDDTEVISADWMEKLLGPLQRPQVAATGAYLFYPDDTILHAGIVIPKSAPKLLCHRAPSTLVFYYGMMQNAREVSAVSASCLLVKRADFESVGGFDEGFATPCGDVDFCLRLQKQLGKTVVVEPRAVLYRNIAVMRNNDVAGDALENAAQEDEKALRKRWPSFFNIGDPLYTTCVEPGSAYYDLSGARSCD